METLPLGKVAASAAVIRRNKILLLQRSEKSKLFPGYWTFPSGGIEEFDPNAESAVSREVKEETGLDFVPKKKFGFYESHAGGKRHFALVHLGVSKGKLRLQESEVITANWFTYKEAKKLNLAFAYPNVIKDLYKSKLIQ
ncbi:NUDIX hydrolase [Candidatus Nomurabacteria bacterium]|nr:NUDIX hydrolase [Candidatus Nomurabacteria bacterium]